MLYDPYSRPMQEDPFPTYRHFLEHEPCTYNAKMDFYALFRFEDVWNATLDWKTYELLARPVAREPRADPGRGVLGHRHGPARAHAAAQRRSRGFTPRRIAALEDEVRGRSRRSTSTPLRDARRASTCEQEFSVKLPMDVISVLLGIPEADRDGYRHTVDKGLERDPETGLPGMENLAMLGRSRDLVLGLLAERRKQPREDLITVIAEAEFDGRRRQCGGSSPTTRWRRS